MVNHLNQRGLLSSWPTHLPRKKSLSYHSKYNPIERCWAILENYWNGAILDSTEAVLSWASNMTWKGNHPQIHLIKQTYQKGIIVRDPELKTFRQFWQCSETLPKWDVTIAPP